jgi:hypothetical protein
VVCIHKFFGHDVEIPDDLVEALHCQIEEKMFIPVNLPLLIIQEGNAE